MKFSYKIQPSPDGLAQAFILGEEFIGEDSVCLVLGDNIFYEDGLINLLAKGAKQSITENQATIFGYYVKDPERYGVAEFNSSGTVISIEEKPINPKSNYAVVGLYFYPNDVIQKAKKVKPSHRGELEITTLNQNYLKENRLKVELMGRGYAWLDTGTHESLLEASQFIQTIVPRGFAHGFVVLEDDTIFAYKVDNYYSPECDRGILFSDKEIGIDFDITNYLIKNRFKKIKSL